MLQQFETTRITPATIATEIDPAAITSDVVSEGYRYWLAQRGTRPFPSRIDIRPADIKAVLPSLILAKVLEDGRDFQFRIVGESIAAAHGLNPINWRVSELDRHADGFSAVVMRVYRRVYESRRPYASRGTLRHLERGYRIFESVFLPLGPSEGVVDHLFVVAAFSGEVDTGLST